MMKRFTARPEELLRRAETKLNAAPPDADDKPAEPGAR